MSSETAEGEEEGVVRIPVASFIDDVEDYLAGREPEQAIKKLNADYQIYKAVEQELLQKKTRLLTKAPDLKKALDMVKLLIDKAGGEELIVDYSLSDQIYATAKLQGVTSVKLWLGADVMLEYDLEEARRLLEENLELAEKNLESNAKDLELMKDYYTTVEVSIARIYNYDIHRRRTGDMSRQKPM